jgi:uncharacterized beta-barrel protein YwiB (DUF1934 family)
MCLNSEMGNVSFFVEYKEIELNKLKNTLVLFTEYSVVQFKLGTVQIQMRFVRSNI